MLPMALQGWLQVPSWSSTGYFLLWAVQSSEGIIAVIFYSAEWHSPSWCSHYSGSIPRGIQAIVRPKPVTLLKRQTTWTVSGVVLIILGFGLKIDLK